jgi:WD40 repeat protein
MSRPARLLLLASALALSCVAPARGGPPATDRHGDPLPAGALARLGTGRLRHPNRVVALAWSADAKVLVASEGDFPGYRGLGWGRGAEGSVRLWDAATGSELRRLGGPAGINEFLAVGGDVLLAAGGEHGARLWRLPGGEEMTTPAGLGGVRCATLSSDGKSLAAGSPGLVRLFDLKSRNEVRRFGLGNAHVLAVRFAPDGKALAVAFYRNPGDQGVCLWDVGTGRELAKLPAAVDGGTVALSPDGKVLAAGTYNQPVRTWGVATGKAIHTLGGRGGGFARSLAFSPDGKALLAVRSDGPVLWDVETGKELRRFGGKWLSAYAGALSPDGKALAVNDGHAVRLFETDTGKELLPSAASVGMVEAVAFSPDGKVALTAGAGVQVWETVSGKHLAGLATGSPVGAAVFAPDGRSVVVGYSREQAIRRLDWHSGQELRRFDGDPGEVEFLGLLDAGRSVVSMCQVHTTRGPTTTTQRRDGALRVWDLATGKPTRRFAVRPMYRATCSLDGRRLAGGLGRFGAWDALSGRELLRLDKPTHVRALALTPDGRRLVASEFARPIRVWEVATGLEMGRLAGHDGVTLALAVSPDGHAVASGGSDGTVRLWELETGKELRRLKGHQGPVLAVAFSPDGRRLLSGSRDTTGLIWDVDGALSAPAAGPLTAKEVERLWLTLAGADSAAALRAVRRLARAPGQALPYARDALGRAPVVEAGRLARLLADLDADDFARREAAGAELARLGKLAEAAMKRALEGRPTPEARRRIGAILKKLDDRLSPAELQALRGVEVLELIGTPAARKVIESVAARAPTPRAGEETRAALARLDRHAGER